MVKLIYDYPEMLFLDLAFFSQVTIVLIKLLECVVLTVMCINLFHNRWISCTQVFKLGPHHLLMLA